MSAELLREAAAKMRELAEGATPGPWEWDDKHYGIFPGPQVDGCCEGDGFIHHSADAKHIAAWHPGVALAVADWLDREAELADWECDAEPAAIDLARAFLGGDA